MKGLWSELKNKQCGCLMKMADKHISLLGLVMCAKADQKAIL
jgi:hypothetical protein